MLPTLAWLAIAGATILAAWAFLRRRPRGKDLGFISPQWIAEQRKSDPTVGEHT
jgi:hypothetical protein